MTGWTGVVFETADSCVENEDVHDWEDLWQCLAEGYDAGVVVDVEFEDLDGWAFRANV